MVCKWWHDCAWFATWMGSVQGYRDMWRDFVSEKHLTLAEHGRNGRFQNKWWWWWLLLNVTVWKNCGILGLYFWINIWILASSLKKARKKLVCATDLARIQYTPSCFLVITHFFVLHFRLVRAKQMPRLSVLTSSSSRSIRRTLTSMNSTTSLLWVQMTSPSELL